ncbi:MAG: autotransporter outer membrane beta-barrel domain-containing protein [Pseudomonadota bacterium]
MFPIPGNILGTPGGQGGAGGDITVGSADAAPFDITTAGEGAHGLVVSTVGGDGGDGSEGRITGLPGGDAGAGGPGGSIIWDNLTGSIVTNQDNAFGIWVETVGGNAGSPGAGGRRNGAFAVGAESGLIDITSDVEITTIGDGSHGLVLVGRGGQGSAGALDLGDSDENGGGPGGISQDITLTQGGNITTAGVAAHGITAMSTGGAGGAGVNAVAQPDNQETPGDGGAGGNAGDISITATGEITVFGEQSIGISAQSIGGVGGAPAISDTGATGTRGSFGNAGTVTVTANGAIRALGAESVGILAQSGTIDAQSGLTSNGGNVNIEVSDVVSAFGKDSYAILAASQGTKGTLSLTINEGARVIAGLSAAGAITLSGGDTTTGHTLTNNGVIAKPDGESGTGYAVQRTGASLTINNNSVFVGSVLLDDDYDNAFNNAEGAVLAVGREFNLGSKGSGLTNYGTISPGGLNRILTSTHSGVRITQAGTLATDLNMGILGRNRDVDQIVITKNGIDLTGEVVPNVTGINLVRDKHKDSQVIINSQGDGHPFDNNATVQDTATVDYGLSITRFDNNQTLSLDYQVDYSGTRNGTLDHGSTNIRNAADQLDGFIAFSALEESEGIEIHAFTAGLTNDVLNAASLDELNDIYTEFLPEEAVLGVAVNRQALVDFQNGLMSCPGFDDEIPDFNRQGECSWGYARGGHFSQSGGFDRLDYDTNRFSFAGGQQYELGEGWFAGYGVSYDISSLNGSGFDGDIDTFQLGAVAKKEIGNWTLSGLLSGGMYFSDFDREVNGSTLAGSPDGRFLAAQGHVSYLVDLDDGLYLKPTAGVTAMQLWQDGFTEKGGLGAVRADAFQDTLTMASPGLEFGLNTDLWGAESRIYTRASALVVLTGETSEIGYDFVNLPGGGSAIEQADKTYYNLGVAGDINFNEQLSLTVSGNVMASENSRGYSALARLSWHF